MPQARLHALHQLIAGLLDRPEPGQLVVGCTDFEALHLIHVLEQLITRRPADRIILLTAPCTDAATYIDPLTTRPDPKDTHLQTLIHRHLSALPAPSSRLVLALVPRELPDREGFADLALRLLDLPLHPRLRLILRDDRLDPRHLDIAAATHAPHRLTHVFSLPPELHLAAVHTALHDRRRPAHERAAALLRLTATDLGRSDRARVLARCEALACSHAAPSLIALTLALTADLLRHRGDFDTASTAALAALEHALAARSSPIVLHAALTLAELHRARGRLADADACYALAERSAHDSAARAHIHRLRVALHEPPS